MKRILFVDDEPMVLSGLQRMLRPMRHEWEMSFAGGGSDALAMMDQQPFDVIVSDMRMPVMNGAQLLAEVMDRHPRIIRFILSGYADKDLTMLCATKAHRFLSKPCDAEDLKTSINLATTFSNWMPNEAIKAGISRMPTIPSLPSVYVELAEKLQSQDSWLDDIGEIIERDPGMTAKILQLVNSAFFGPHRRIANATEAVMVLGLETIRALVLNMHIFSSFPMQPVAGISVERLWNHSIAAGTLARKIMRAEGAERKLADEAFTAGLLHDVGKLILASHMPEDYYRARKVAEQSRRPLCEVEGEILGITHAEAGAYLLGLWGLPVSLVEAVSGHHCPKPKPGEKLTTLAAVHVANCLEKKFRETGAAPAIDLDYLSAIGCEHLEEFSGE